MTHYLDQKFGPENPTREQLNGEVRGVPLADNGNPDHGPYVRFRASCGADGYRCSASFRDHEGYGGGATPREAMISLASGLRELADRVIQAARCNCDRPRQGPHEPTCPARKDVEVYRYHAKCRTCGWVGRTYDNESHAENDGDDHEIAVGTNEQHHYTRVVKS